MISLLITNHCEYSPDPGEIGGAEPGAAQHGLQRVYERRREEAAQHVVVYAANTGGLTQLDDHRQQMALRKRQRDATRNQLHNVKRNT